MGKGIFPNKLLAIAPTDAMKTIVLLQGIQGAFSPVTGQKENDSKASKILNQDN
jgi:hypothetical protein